MQEAHANPEAAVELEKTLNDLPKTHASADLSAEAPPLVKELAKKGVKPLSQQFLSKKEKKKQKEQTQRIEKMKELGLNDQQISQMLMREEYNKAPLHEKLERLEVMVARGMQGLSRDISNLEHNDAVLADAMDVNFRAVAKALELAGISLEKQKEVMELAQKEIAEEQARRQAEQSAKAEAAQKKSADVAEQATVEQTTDQAGEPPPPPSEATSFGG